MALTASPPGNILCQQEQPELSHQQLQQQQPMGTKRNRVLTRQPRVKRDSDSLSNAHVSPEPSLAGGIDYDPFGITSSNNSHSNYPPVHGHQAQLHQHAHHHHHHHHLLTVPTRIERHSSEPAPSITPSSPHLLSVPQNTHFLMKQHSDPLLPSQHSLIVASGGTNPFAPLHRQYSHPLSSTTSSSSASGSGNGSTSSHITPTATLQHPHHISLPESMYTSGGSPPPAGSSQYLVPQQSMSGGSATTVVGNVEVSAVNVSGTCTSAATSPAIAVSVSPTKTLTLPQFTTTYISSDSDMGRTNSPTNISNTTARVERVLSESNTPPPVTKFRSSKSTGGVSLGERMSNLHPSTTTHTSSSFEHLPSLRVKNEELQRSVSSPQTSREIITLENPRSSHCPVIRPGPALGCNFCWNTIDGHGRILRRKTKYHCPECQTNLCIVPCFQEYHERQNSESTNTSSTASNNDNSSSKPFAGAANRSGSSGNGTRHYSKTESI